jgi:hypothetical protein
MAKVQREDALLNSAEQAFVATLGFLAGAGLLLLLHPRFLIYYVRILVLGTSGVDGLWHVLLARQRLRLSSKVFFAWQRLAADMRKCSGRMRSLKALSSRSWQTSLQVRGCCTGTCLSESVCADM